MPSAMMLVSSLATSSRSASEEMSFKIPKVLDFRMLWKELQSSLLRKAPSVDPTNAPKEMRIGRELGETLHVQGGRNMR